MTIKTLGVLSLLLAPAAIIYLAGFLEAGQYVALGAVLALQLSVLARPVAAFSILLPAVYLAAAITARSTDGVVMLIVAVAALLGAASSKGLHRGLLALLAAALLGSFEPGGTGQVVARAAYLLAGSSYGFMLAATVLRHVDLAVPPLRPQPALGYTVLLAAVALVAWFAVRYSSLAQPAWLPLVVVAVSEPERPSAARRALLRSLLATGAALLLVLAADRVEVPALRVVLLGAVLLAALSAGRRHPALPAVLMAPVLVLLTGQTAVYETALDFLRAALPPLVAATAVSVLAHWLYWTQRPGADRIAA